MTLYRRDDDGDVWHTERDTQHKTCTRWTGDQSKEDEVSITLEWAVIFKNDQEHDRYLVSISCPYYKRDRSNSWFATICKNYIDTSALRNCFSSCVHDSELSRANQHYKG